MAKENKNSIKANLDQFRTLSKLTTEELYGTSEKFHDENNRDLTDIKNTINIITQRFKENTGDDIIEFFNAVNLNAQPNRNTKLAKENAKKQLLDITNVIEHPETFNVTEIFSQEMSRVQLYNSYRLIYENIPQMTQALNTYVDNILSPDDFTKKVFNVTYKDVALSEDNTNLDSKDIMDNCNKLIEDYKLESLSKSILTEALTIGDCFVSVLSVDSEIEKTILSEDGVMINSQIPEYKEISSNDIELSESEIMQLSAILDDKIISIPTAPPPKEEYFKEGKNLKSLTESYNSLIDTYNEETKIFNEESTKIKKDLAQCINNIEISDNYKCLFESNISANREFKEKDKSKNDLFNNFTSNDEKDRLENLTKQQKYNKNANKGKIHVDGSIVKVLKPDRIVKLSLDNVEYGYYYVENLENSPDYATTGSYSMTSNIFSNFKNEQTDKPDLSNAKYRLITDVFVRNLAKRINKKFVNNHPEFKNIICNLLKQNYILDKQVRIVYLKPSEVIHFGSGNEEYKDSIYKPIHFTAKLYLAVLTSQVMLRLVRAPEKRKNMCDLI